MNAILITVLGGVITAALIGIGGMLRSRRAKQRSLRAELVNFRRLIVNNDSGRQLSSLLLQLSVISMCIQSFAIPVM
jgi:hypothetical protein